MGSITINYNQLETTKRYFRNCSNTADNYAKDLTRKYSNKANRITGGSSFNLSQAGYYVDRKIRELDDKSINFKQFSQKIDSFCGVAKRVDREVKQSIEVRQHDYMNTHDMHVSPWLERIINWWVDLENSNPFFAAIGDVINNIQAGFASLKEEIRYWYNCAGGRQVLDTIGAVIVAVGAVVGAVVAVLAVLAASGVWATIAAVCGVVLAVIAAVDAGVNLANTVRQNEAFANGDKAWASIYGGLDKFSDWVKFTNFGSAEENQRWGRVAFAVEVTRFVCECVKIIDGFVQLSAKLANVHQYLKSNGGFSGIWKGKHLQDGQIVNTIVVNKDGTYGNAPTGLKGILNIWKGGTANMPDKIRKGFQFTDELKTWKNIKKVTDGTKSVHSYLTTLFDFGAGITAAKGIYELTKKYGAGFTGTIDKTGLIQTTSEDLIKFKWSKEVFGKSVIGKFEKLKKYPNSYSTMVNVSEIKNSIKVPAVNSVMPQAVRVTLPKLPDYSNIAVKFPELEHRYNFRLNPIEPGRGLIPAITIPHIPSIDVKPIAPLRPASHFSFPAEMLAGGLT